MPRVAETYQSLQQASQTIARTIEQGLATVTEAISDEAPAERQRAMLKVAEIKRQLNELNGAFGRLESAVMSHRR